MTAWLEGAHDPLIGIQLGFLKAVLVHRHAFIPNLAATARLGRGARVPASARPLLAGADGPPEAWAPVRAALARGRWSRAASLLSRRPGAEARALQGLLALYGEAPVRAGRPLLETLLLRYAHPKGLALLRKARSLSPRDPRAAAWLALAQLRACRLGECRETLADLAALAPDWSWTWLIDSERARVDIEFAASGAALSRAEALEPGNPWTAAQRSRVLFQAEPGPAGLAALDKALALDPLAGWAWAWRGDARRKLGDLKGALADLWKAKALEPEYDRTYLWLGKTLGALGDHERALACLDEGLRRVPHFEKAHAQRSQSLRRLGRLEEAVKALNAAAAINHRHNWLRNWTAEPEPLTRDGERSLADIDALVAARPAWAWGWAWRGESRLQTGDPRGALADLDAALSRSPRLAWARAWRGEALLRLGRQDEAGRELSAALALDPGYGRALAWRGRLRQLQGRFGLAVADLDRAVSDSLVEYSWVYFWRAEARRGLGDLAAARRDAQTASALDPRRPEFRKLASELEAVPA